MGIKERQEREREAVGRAILDAARELFVTEGYRNVSIRRIADRIEYSPASIYSYFASKDDIFLDLAEEGFRMLAEGWARAAERQGDPLDAVRAGFWHYYEFSRSHPQYFELMFLDRSVPRISRDWERFGFLRDMLRSAEGCVRRCIDAGVLPPDLEPGVALRILRTAIHGAATTALCRRFAPGEDIDALARDTLEAAIAGLKAGIVTTFDVTSCPLHAGTHPRTTETEQSTLGNAADLVAARTDESAG